MPATAPRVHERRVAPRVLERHGRRCGLSLGRRRCSCQPTYRARVRVGRAVGEETFGTLAEAIDWAERLRATLHAGGSLSRRVPAPLLRDAAVSFLHRAREGSALTRSRRPYAAATLAGYETVLRRHVLALPDGRSGLPLGDLSADALDARALQAAIDVLAARETPEVARLAAAAVGAVLRDMYDRGLIDVMPPRLKLPPPARGRERVVTVAEADRLLEAAEADDAARGRSLMAPLVGVLIGTGARISEALGLVWEAVDLDADPPRVTISRATTKTDAGARVVTLERTYAAVLRRHRMAVGRPETGPVFADENGRRLDRGGRVRSGLARVTKAAGLPGVSPHVLRHAHGSWLAAAGEDATHIAARLGHTDPALTLRRYVHANPERLATTPGRLADLRERERQTAGRTRGVQTAIVGSQLAD